MRLTVAAKCCLVVAAMLLLSADTCDPLKIDAAAGRIQQAINDLSQNLSQFQTTLTKLEQDLVAQGQSTIAHEVTQLAQRTVATAGTVRSGDEVDRVDFVCTQITLQ